MTGIYGRPQLLVSRRVRSARLRLQRQRRVAVGVARGGLLRHRRAQPQGRLLGLFLGGPQRARAEPHAAALHVQRQRPRHDAVHRRQRQPPVPDQRLLLPVAALGPARSHADDRPVRPGPVDGRAHDAAGRGALRPRLELGAGRGQRHHADVALQPAADQLRSHRQRARLQRHHAAARLRLRRVRHRQDGAQGQPRQVRRGGHLRRHLQLQQPGGADHHSRSARARRRRAAGPTATATSSWTAIC